MATNSVPSKEFITKNSRINTYIGQGDDLKGRIIYKNALFYINILILINCHNVLLYFHLHFLVIAKISR